MSVVQELSDGQMVLWCPGCDCFHGFYPKTKPGPGPRWDFDGDMDKPTINPSLLVTRQYGDGREQTICHSFIRNGQWQYLNDSTHILAGQTVDVVLPT